ncbi:MAG TPA: RagB/SusD family nutrient uptake outer membrane protein [Cyclobacteriaceae bacterium]|nr:RagB/SusD family nutrient uptake outer membrane protein [Cyclobacteriaceae bacterium]
MKNYRMLISLTTVLVFSVVFSCKDFLDTKPYGVVTADALDTPLKTEELVISAYAGLGNSTWNSTYTSDWVWGSVRSDDAYKGGSGVADQGDVHNLEVYNLVQSAIPGYQQNTWIAVYQALSRVNNVLRQLDKFSDTDYVVTGLTNARVVRQAEMRFLRGHFMFVLKRLFKYPVWIEPTATQDEIKLISNRVLTSDQLWDKIAADFQFAYDNLPATQTQKGRANKFAAAAYLAKTRLYQAYTQDDKHNVTGISPEKLQQVVTMTDAVINSGRYSLVDNYGKKWTFTNENNSESIFAVQYSYDDGTTWGRVDFEHGLNYNMASVYGCCSFHHASQNLVNAFRTDIATGLPLFDSFNNGEMKNPEDFALPKNTVDPRLDHTVGIPSHPFKYDVNFVAQTSWSRTPAVYGTFLPMKEIQHTSCNCIRKGGAFFGTAQNWDILQYNDVLLMKAEALIELGQHADAMPLINQVRQRAKNSTQWITYPAGHAKAGQGFSSYNVSLYNGINLAWTQANARKALQWERRLEFAMESPRFHDLVRWGIAAETLNGYLNIEKGRGHAYMNTAVFTKGRDEYLPIPQAQINLVDGLYTQNPGY